jgi:hypothetical protein
MADWFVYQAGGAHLGPYNSERVAQGIITGQFPESIYVGAPGGARWLRAMDVPVIARLVGRETQPFYAQERPPTPPQFLAAVPPLASTTSAPPPPRATPLPAPLPVRVTPFPGVPGARNRTPMPRQFNTTATGLGPDQMPPRPSATPKPPALSDAPAARAAFTGTMMMVQDDELELITEAPTPHASSVPPPLPSALMRAASLEAPPSDDADTVRRTVEAKSRGKFAGTVMMPDGPSPEQLRSKVPTRDS